MTYAWVLILAMNMNHAITVPGIVSEAECHRLATEIPVYGIQKHRCFKYQVAR